MYYSLLDGSAVYTLIEVKTLANMCVTRQINLLASGNSSKTYLGFVKSC